MPGFISCSLPAELYAHAEESIDFGGLRGRRIAVFGAASSAFDAAAVALEHGAASVHLFCRHDDLERYSLMRMLYYPGSVEHFRSLPDAERWKIMSELCRRAQGPVPDTVRRAVCFESFHLHFGARDPVLETDGRVIAIRLGGHDTNLEFDFVIAGTGYRIDLSARPELRSIVDHIALWSDRYQPPQGEENEELMRYPYLTPGFGFTEKKLGTAPYLKDIHFFSAGALISNGRNPGEVSGFRHGIPHLVSAIGGDLFTADVEQHVAALSDRANRSSRGRSIGIESGAGTRSRLRDYPKTAFKISCSVADRPVKRKGATMNKITRLDQAALQEGILDQARTILKCESIGPQTYFLEVGGDSLMAPIFANRIEAEFGVRPQLEDIFTRSFGELAQLLSA